MDTLKGMYSGIAAGFMSVSLLMASGVLVAQVPAGPAPGQGVTLTGIPPDAYQGLAIIDLERMAEMRGGFSIAGLDLKFGATLRTLIDNIKLETVFNITQGGAQIVSQVLSDLSQTNESVAAVNIATTGVEGMAGQAGEAGQAATGQVSQNATANASSSAVLVGGGASVSLSEVTPADANLDGLSSAGDFSGVAVNNNKGFTTALHKLTQQAAIGAIISSASDIKAHQELNIRVEIANTRAARQAAKAAKLSQWNALKR